MAVKAVADLGVQPGVHSRSRVKWLILFLNFRFCVKSSKFHISC
jgi:hypothetical protein